MAATANKRPRPALARPWTEGRPGWSALERAGAGWIALERAGNKESERNFTAISEFPKVGRGVGSKAREREENGGRYAGKKAC